MRNETDGIILKKYFAEEEHKKFLNNMYVEIDFILKTILK